MAITQVTEARSPRFSKISQTGQRVFHVYFDEFTDYATMFDEASAAVDPNTGLKIPVEGDDFGGNPVSTGQRKGVTGAKYITTAVVEDVDIELFNEQNKIVEVTVSFAVPENDDEEDKETPDNPFNPTDYPWQQPPLDSFTHSNVQRLMTVDLDGRPIVNSAGDAFDTPITVPVAVRRQPRTRNVKSGWNQATAARDINKVDQGGKRLCIAHDGVQKLYTKPDGSVTKYWAITQSWDIITSSEPYDTWQGKIQDRGYRDGDGKKILIDGEPAISPVKLNGSGEPLKNPLTGNNNPIGNGTGLRVIGGLSNDTNGVWLEYKKYAT